MPTFEFDHKTIKALKPGPKRIDYWDTTDLGPGKFGLRLTPAGVKTWCVIYRHRGRDRRRTIGRYSATLGLSKARADARDLLAQVQLGRDPAGEKRAARAVDQQTVRALFNAYVTHAEVRVQAGEFRSWPQIRQSLERDVLPEWGPLPCQSIRRKHVIELVTKKAITGAASANALHAHLSMLFGYGVEADWLTGNPVAGLKKRRAQVRQRVLDDDEIRAVWGYLETDAPITLTRGKAKPWPMAPSTAATLRDLFKFLLLTGQRLGETSRATWADMDLDAKRWTIPATETKNGRAQNVPLSADALALIQRRRDAAPSAHVYAFPSTPSGKGSVLVWSKRTAAAIARATNVTFTAHDLRRTLSTRLGDMGIPGDTIDAVLNHSRAGVLRHYDHSTREKQKRDALDRWAAELTRIVTAQPTKVLKMRGAR